MYNGEGGGEGLMRVVGVVGVVDVVVIWCVDAKCVNACTTVLLCSG